MNAPQRRNLLLGLERTAAPAPEPELVETAARHGFASVPRAASPELERETPAASLRRQRSPTGRNHQFNVRLRAETLQAIYEQANSRNVPIAQVIEEAMAALERQTRSER